MCDRSPLDASPNSTSSNTESKSYAMFVSAAEAHTLNQPHTAVRLVIIYCDWGSGLGFGDFEGDKFLGIFDEVLSSEGTDLLEKRSTIMV